MKFNAGGCDEYRTASLKCIEKFGGGEAGVKACDEAVNKYKDCKKQEAVAKSIERQAVLDDTLGNIFPFQKEIGGFVRGVVGMEPKK
jgi:hypothetical protein